MKITAWRIVKARLQNQAFDGQGAQIAGGRWNQIGIPMIYTADSLALAALEIIVHLAAPDFLKRRYVRIPVRFDSRVVTALDLADLPDDWDSFPPSESAQQIGTEWALSKKSLILKVPSAVIREEFNYLINPAHPDFNLLSIGAAAMFVFDPRVKV